MAIKTVVRLLLGKYGMMTVEMEQGMDMGDDAFDQAYRKEANTEDFSAVVSDDVVDIDPETGEVIPPDNRGSRQMDDEPETEPSFAL